MSPVLLLRKIYRCCRALRAGLRSAPAAITERDNTSRLSRGYSNALACKCRWCNFGQP